MAPLEASRTDTSKTMADMYFMLQVLTTFVIIFWTWRVVSWAWWKPLRLQKHLRKQGFTGAPYKLLYGDAKEMMRSYQEANSKPIQLSNVITPRVLPFAHQTVKKYGNMCIHWYGPTPRVQIMKPELIKNIMTTHFRDVIKPRPNAFLKLFVTGVTMYEGQKWVKHRKIVNAAFNVEKLKMMLPAFQISCSELISKWENSCISKDSCEVDVWPDLQNLTGSAISRTAFGTNYEEAHRVFSLQCEQAAHFVQTARSLDIPGLRFLPTRRNRRMKEIDREVRGILRGIIEKREKDMRNGEKNNTDLLGMLLESNLEAMKGNEKSKDNNGMSMDDIMEECRLFYFAGQETSAAHVLWTMILLSMHQEWQQKARDEVLQVFGKRKPDYAGLSNLKIVPMILNEVLRLYPPVASLVRITQKDIEIGEISLPAGVKIELPVLMIHHDRELWGEDADDFKPERFSEGVSKATKNQLSFFPFGWGPRICVGQNFAMLEVKLVMTMILQSFSFELSANYAHAPHSVITVQPQYGAQIILHKL